MKNNFTVSLALVLESEGKYVWDKRDPGGETMMGVTRNSWATWLKRPIQDGEMANLTVADVTPFYKAIYWDWCKCDDLPLGVDYLVFDFAVNAGCNRAIKTFQEAIGCVPDGVIGTNTLKCLQEANNKDLIVKFSDAKRAYYKSLKLFPVFGTGWLNRVDRVQKQAEAMV